MLDVAFDFTGQHLLTASADSTARCYNAVTHNLVSKFEGHEGEISKVSMFYTVCLILQHSSVTFSLYYLCLKFKYLNILGRNISFYELRNHL